MGAPLGGAIETSPNLKVRPMTETYKQFKKRRPVQIWASTVVVLCPYCNEPFPSLKGSELWTVDELVALNGSQLCDTCNKKVSMVIPSKARLHA